MGCCLGLLVSYLLSIGDASFGNAFSKQVTNSSNWPNGASGWLTQENLSKHNKQVKAMLFREHLQKNIKVVEHLHIVREHNGKCQENNM